ncbi:hypothetical protein DRO03_09130 [Methanosarcinales archaeon]|nr:MAG: hypothetical protein DRO03_09130 [Methanosarcinales archaeon]
MERFTKYPICGASVRTRYLQSLDSRGIAGAKRPPLSKFYEAEQCFDRTPELNLRCPPAARNPAMLYLLCGMREKASKDRRWEDYF